MIEKMSHLELIRRCKKVGINIHRITREYAYVNIPENTAFADRIPENKVPSRFPQMPAAFRNIAFIAECKDEKGIPLHWYVHNNRKLNAVKLIRDNTGLGLADCVFIYNYWFNSEKKV